MKRPKVAFWLSFLLPGAGLCYVGQWGWGVLNFVGVLVVGNSLVFVGVPERGWRLFLGLPLAFASGVYADMQARRRNEREAAERRASEPSLEEDASGENVKSE